MSHRDTYVELLNWISGGSVILVTDVLSRDDDLDITYSDGQHYDFGALLISSVAGDTQRGSTGITELLIEYYEAKQLPKLTVGSPEYNILRYRFKASLELAQEGESLSTEMQALFSRYINFDSDEHDDDGLSDEHHMLGADSDHSVHSTNSSLTQSIVGQLPQAQSSDLGMWLAGQASAASDVGDHST